MPSVIITEDQLTQFAEDGYFILESIIPYNYLERAKVIIVCKQFRRRSSSSA